MRVAFATLVLAIFALIFAVSWLGAAAEQAQSAFVAADVAQSTASPLPQDQKSPTQHKSKVTPDANHGVVSSSTFASTSEAPQDQRATLQQPKSSASGKQLMRSNKVLPSISPGQQDQKNSAGQEPKGLRDVEKAEGDPDLPAGGEIDKEEYLMLRNEFIAMLRGYLPDQPFDPTARGRAIEETERQERQLADSKFTALTKLINPDINTDTWTPIGPSPIPSGQTFGGRSDPVSGRTIAIAVHPTNPNIVYAGTAAGGVFRSLDGGANWTPIFDSAQSLGVDAIAIAPSQPSTVYIGTGEIIGFFGVGVYRIDNADSANPTLVGPINPVTDQGNGINAPAFQQTAISEILVHPTDPATIFVSTARGFGGIVSHDPSSPNSRSLFGVYRSTNATNAAAAITFTKLTVNTNGGLVKGDTEITDMAMEPGNPNTILGWVEGAAGSGGVYRSANALAASPTFTQTLVTNTSYARGELAINKIGSITTVLAATGETPVGSCPSGQNGRLRRSTDGGQTWPTSLSGGDGFCGGQCFYDIAVDMNWTSSSPIIHIGGAADYNTGDCASINKRSVDGGSTFAKNETGLHPDVHVVAVAPSNQNIVYTGNDGGIWKSTDGGATWTSLNNSSYSATQFISIALHPTDREYMTGGTQDNGTEFRRANGTWTQMALGDGGYTLIDRNATDTTNVTIYHTYYNKKNVQILFERVTTTAAAEAKNWVTLGAFLDSNRNCTSNNGINCSDSVLFYAPMALGPGNPNTVYFGTDRLYRSTNKGDTMTVVGSVASISGGSPLASISISPQNDNVRIVGLQNGQVWGTSSGGTFTNITPPNAPSALPVGKVFVDPTNASTAYVTYGGFGVSAGRHIFKTVNLSASSPTWSDSGNGIPDVPVDAFTVDRLTPQNLYAGTDIGVYRSTDGGSSWVPFNGGLPRVPVFDIGFQEQGQTNPNSARVLRIATHGRGIWEIQVGVAGGCTYSLNPTSQSFGSSGGNGSFALSTAAACAWSAVSNASWITTSSSGSGNGTVNYTVATNSSSARTGTITVGGQTFTVSQSAGSGGCPSTTIAVGQTTNGTLTTSDCFFTGTTRYVDIYNFSGTAGQQVAIALNSSAFDTYLYLLDSGNQLLAQDDDGGGSTNARIPAVSGFYRLPATGSYTIYATSYAESSTGAYSMTLSTASGCSYSINPTSQIFIASASTGSFTVTAGPGCAWTARSNVGWLTTTSTGSGSGTVNYSVAANTGNSRTGTISVASETFNVFQSAGNGNGCPVTTIALGQTINTTLTTGCVFTSTSRYVDPYDFTGTAGQRIAITMSSSAFDTYLFLNDPNNQTIAQDDDGGGSSNSRIPSFNGFFTLPTTGTYRIFATSYSADGINGSTGPYTISLLSSTSSTPTLQFSASTYNAGEASGFIIITVTRSGDTSAASTVAYATSNGTAKEGKDYVAAQGVLSFAAGETSKSLPVLIIDNAFVDGTRTVNLALSNPTGATLATTTAVLTINDNDVVIGPNPLDAPRSFVQYHYYDFLGRYPDPSGWDFWTNEITSCGSNQACIDLKRINVSAAYFLSIEFQQTGYLVERIYKAAYGNATGTSTFGGSHTLSVPIIRRSEFSSDTQEIGQGVIVGQTGWEQALENNKVAFTAEFVQRSRFTSAYATSLTPTQFVDALFAHAGVTPSSTDRSAAINEFGVALNTADLAARGRALRRVAENSILSANESNRAFVLMQYFGYLRRNPNDSPDSDYTGYDFWLTKLNQFNGNFVNAEMVKAFIVSG